MTLIPPKTRIMLKFLLPQRRRPDPRHAIPEADRDLTGKTVVFTGGTDGMGRLAVEILREMGADLVLLGRSDIKGEAVATELRAIEGAGTVEFQRCDLASMASVQACAARLLATRSRIDVLINCAGAHLSERRVTVDGFEANWAVNYLGPYLLTRLLLDRIQESEQARIVNLTTNTDWLKHFNFDDVQSANDFDATDAYTQGKLALSMFTRTLGEQLEGTGVTVNCLNPGYIQTTLKSDAEGLMAMVSPLIQNLASPTLVGADRVVRLAVSSEYTGVNGEFVFEDMIHDPHVDARDDAKRARLTALSEAAVAPWLEA